MRQEYRDLKQSGGPVGDRKFADLKKNTSTDDERTVVKKAKERVVR